MAAVNFPNSPSNGDSHTSGGSTWTWNGTVWQRIGVAGPQGAQGVQGATGTGTGTADKIYEGNTQAEVVDPGTNGYFKVDVEGIEALRIIRKTRISSEGRVGIGTTDPDRSLVVNSDDQVVGLLSTRNTGNRSFLRFMDPSTTAEPYAPAIGSSGANLDLRTGGAGSENANRLRITGIGSVGIGTDDPVAKLDISGKTIIGIKTNYSNTLNISGSGLGVTGFRALNIIDENAVIKLSRTHDTYGSGVDFQHWNPNISTMYGRGFVGIESGSMYLMNTTEEGYIHFNTTPSGGSHTERLRITGIGSVGIGTDDPVRNLTIHGGSGEAKLNFSNVGTGATGTVFGANSNGNTILWIYEDKPFYVATNNQERLRITAAGNIGIAQINPQHKLHVVGDIYASGDLLAGDDVRNAVPADFWATDTTFINFGGVGNICHMGSYQTVITSNGYRTTTSGQWKSNAVNSNTGAAQIVLHPTGVITFGTESNKSNGSSWTVDTKLRITADGKMGVNTGANPHAYLDVNTDETLSSTAGIGLTIAEFRGAVGNASQLEFKHVRLSTGTDWTTVTTRIQRKIDSTNMGYIDFGTGGGGSGRDIQFGSGNGNLMVHFDNTGKVGVGTDNPVGNLEVRDSKANLIVAKDGLPVKGNSDLAASYDMIQLGAGGALASYSATSVTADTMFIHNAYRHSGNNWKRRYQDTAARMRVNSPANTWIFETAATGSADSDITSWDESLRITSIGRLLIGTSTANKAGSYSTVVSTGGDANNGGFMAHYNTGAYGGGSMTTINAGGGGLIFWTYTGNLGSESYSERLRIDSNGNIGINCDSPTNISNHRGITLQGSGGSAAGFINFMDSADNSDARILADNGVLTITADASDNTASSAIAFNVDGTSEKLSIKSNGSINFSNTTIATKNTSGDITIDFGNLTSNAGNAWRKCGVWIMYNGIDTDATDNKSVVYYTGVGAVTTWNWVGDTDTMSNDSFNSVTLQNAATTGFRLYCDVNNQNTGTVFVMIHGWNTKPTITIN